MENQHPQKQATIDGDGAQCRSGQHQSVRNQWREITPVAGCQGGLSPDGHGGDTAVRVALGTSAGQIEEVRRAFRVVAFERDREGKKATRQRFGGGGERAQRNSPQASELMPIVSPAVSQVTNCASCGLPGTSASIRKLVSK
jgi:hypothetical protein